MCGVDYDVVVATYRYLFSHWNHGYKWLRLPSQLCFLLSYFGKTINVCISISDIEISLNKLVSVVTFILIQLEQYGER